MDKYIFWAAARKNVWAWINGNRDEIDALRKRVKVLEEIINEI